MLIILYFHTKNTVLYFANIIGLDRAFAELSPLKSAFLNSKKKYIFYKLQKNHM